MNAQAKNEEGPQISNLALHIKTLEKEKQTKLKASRKKEIIKWKLTKH